LKWARHSLLIGWIWYVRFLTISSDFSALDFEES